MYDDGVRRGLVSLRYSRASAGAEDCGYFCPMRDASAAVDNPAFLLTILMTYMDPASAQGLSVEDWRIRLLTYIRPFDGPANVALALMESARLRLIR